MANITIKIEKNDVKTSKLGNNVMINCENNINLIFTPEALEELINDYNNIICDENGEQGSSGMNQFYVGDKGTYKEPSEKWKIKN